MAPFVQDCLLEAKVEVIRDTDSASPNSFLFKEYELYYINHG